MSSSQIVKRGRQSSPPPPQGGLSQSAASRTLLRSTASLALQTAATQRQLVGALQHVALLPADGPVATALTAKCREFFEGRSSGKQASLLGSPHLHVFNELLTVLCQSTSSSVEDRSLLDRIRNEFSTVQALDGHVFICRIAPAYNPSQKKLCLSVASDFHACLAAILRGLAALGADLRHGPPPKSGQERTVARDLRQYEAAFGL